MVDIEIADKKALGDLERVSKFLDKVPDAIGMKKLTPPIAFQYNPYGDESHSEAGITGFIIIAESHISIHTYSNQGKAYFDAFSCKPFDSEKVLKLLLEEFKVKRYKSYLVERGTFNSAHCAIPSGKA